MARRPLRLVPTLVLAGAAMSTVAGRACGQDPDILQPAMHELETAGTETLLLRSASSWNWRRRAAIERLAPAFADDPRVAAVLRGALVDEDLVSRAAHAALVEHEATSPELAVALREFRWCHLMPAPRSNDRTEAGHETLIARLEDLARRADAPAAAVIEVARHFVDRDAAVQQAAAAALAALRPGLRAAIDRVSTPGPGPAKVISLHSLGFARLPTESRDVLLARARESGDAVDLEATRALCEVAYDAEVRGLLVDLLGGPHGELVAVLLRRFCYDQGTVDALLQRGARPGPGRRRVLQALGACTIDRAAVADFLDELAWDDDAVAQEAVNAQLRLQLTDPRLVGRLLGVATRRGSGRPDLALRAIGVMGPAANAVLGPLLDLAGKDPQLGHEALRAALRVARPEQRGEVALAILAALAGRLEADAATDPETAPRDWRFVGFANGNNEAGALADLLWAARKVRD